MFAIGTILRAKGSNSVSGVGLYSKYSPIAKAAGESPFTKANLIKTIAQDQTFGIIQEMDNVNNIALVALSIQVFNSTGKQVTHAYCDLSLCESIQAIISTGTKYYASQDVNIRNGSGVVSTIRTVARKGDYLGYSDGVKDKNGFCRFQLAIGGIGYISSKYITTSTQPRTYANESVDIEAAKPVYTINQKIIGIAGAIGAGAISLFLLKKK